MFSSHPTKLHMAWPLAYVARLHRRSSCIAAFRRARDLFISRLRAQGTPDCILNYVVDNTDYFMPFHNTNNVKCAAVVGTSYLVLPFHPLWASSGLSSAVSRFSRNTDHRQLLQLAFGSLDPFLVRCSWKLSAPALGTTLVDW